MPSRPVFVHAGCAVLAGRPILVPGRTLAGKSSLTAALVRAGATYWSDEYAVLRPDGRVVPYAREPALRPRDDEGPGLSRRVPVTELGGRAGRGSATVALVAHLRHDRSRGWAVQALTAGGVVLALLDNAVAARSRPRAVLDAVTAAARTADGLAGSRGEADEAAAALLIQLETGTQEAGQRRRASNHPNESSERRPSVTPLEARSPGGLPQGRPGGVDAPVRNAPLSPVSPGQPRALAAAPPRCAAGPGPRSAG